MKTISKSMRIITNLNINKKWTINMHNNLITTIKMKINLIIRIN